MVKILTFSERYGYKKVSDVIQYKDMTDDLRNSLFNVLVEHILDVFCRGQSRCSSIYESLYAYNYEPYYDDFFNKFYVNFLKRPVTQIPHKKTDAWHEFQRLFLGSEWHVVYSVLEWFVRDCTPAGFRTKLCKNFNVVLEDNGSGYRIVDEQFVPISDTNEISAVEEAIETQDCEGSAKHLQTALGLLADHDYRNSVKESISAVEAFVRCKTGKSTLGDALSELEKSGIVVPNVLKQGFQKIYGWTCGEDGIRHAIMDGAQEVTVAEAKFMLVTCSAFINYLKMKGAA